MTKTFFHRETGNACVFEDSANLADWPDFQEFPLPTVLTRAQIVVTRNLALQDSDWMAVQDRTMTQEQTDYRAALRGIPQQTAFQEGRYEDIVWPEKLVDTSSA